MLTTAPAYHSLNLQARPTTPARFLGSSSPLPPPTSTYALVSSTRNLGTPMSDIRATSPSSNVNYQSNDSDHPPAESTCTRPSSSSHRDWSQHPSSRKAQAHRHHTPTVNSLHPPQPSPSPNPEYLKPSHRLQSPSVALPGVQKLLESRLDCFWAILNENLKLVYIDPVLRQRLGSSSDRIHHYSVYQFVHPADLDQFMLDLDDDRFHPPIVPTEVRQDPNQPSSHRSQIRLQPARSSSSSANELEIGSTQHSSWPVIRCRFARNAQLRRLLAADGQPNSIESDEQYKPTELLLYPIGQAYFLAFFHSIHVQPPESHGHAPYSPWTTLTNHSSFRACGISEPEPEINYFNREEAYLLERAINLSQSPSTLSHRSSSIDTSSSFKPGPSSLDVFLILDSSNGRTLSTHHSLCPGTLADYHFCPEDYAYLAMQSKRRKPDEPSGQAGLLGNTNCSRQLTGQHRLFKDGSAINVLQSFVIEYGSLTFAAFRSTLPSPPRPQSVLNQRSNTMMGNVKPSPLELVQESRPMALDLYSPTSSRLARSHKRPRTDSCSDVLTPQSASSTHSQAFNQQHYPRPSTHPTHQYSTFNSHHPHHPSHQLSSMTSSTIPLPESPDPYGSQYTHFSGELSPTMASAANVLGSFHRAHYHHPQSILALQDVHHQISPPSSAHSSMVGYDNYGLQNLASMAVTASFDRPPPPPDFSSGSSGSSPHPCGNESFVSVLTGQSGPLSSSVHRAYRAPTKAGGMAAAGGSPDSVTDHLLSIGLGPSHNYAQSSDVLSAGYSPMADGSSVALSFHENRASLKRQRPITSEGHASVSTRSAVTGGDGNGAPRCCTSCGAQNSPEWRKGPNGIKSLCNACGLRFSRAQARKSKVPKNMSSNGNLKKVAGVLNKKKPTGQQGVGGSVLGEEDSRLVVEAFRG